MPAHSCDCRTAIASSPILFGGNPVAVAAAHVVLDRITAPGFLARVERRGEQLRRGLQGLARKHQSQVREVRGLGLMWGMELEQEAGPIITQLRARGILATKAGSHVLRVLPPLMVQAGELRTFLTALEEILDEL